MKTLEEIKKFFPNHKFEDDLIQIVKELKPEVRRFVNAQKRKKIITVEQMYLENLRKEKSKDNYR